ncbi:LysM peptidoglycan-binding domain-containing protein [Spirosoma humi]
MTVLSTAIYAQSLPEVPLDLDFAGMTVHLTQPARLQVQKEVQHLYLHHGLIENYINTVHQVNPLLNPLLTRADIPADFIHVALPFSDVDTVGFWALSTTQATNLKLRIDETVDERFHLLLSAEVALIKLDQLQKIQGNFVSVLIHYLNQDTNTTPADSVDPFYILLGPENPVLLWKILARKLVFDHEKRLYKPLANYVLFDYQQGAGKTLENIASNLRISVEQVKAFNKWLKSTVVPATKKYSVLIQVKPDEFSSVRSIARSEEKTTAVNQRDIGFPILIKIKERRTGMRSSAIYYKINDCKGIQAQNCDNFITLAFYGNISIKTFLKYNDLTLHDVARPGEIYYLERKAKRAKVPFHVVEKNQTLHDIAQLYGVRLKSLLKYNNMASNQRVQMGRILWLQTKQPKNRPVEYRRMPVDQEEKPIDEPITIVTNTSTEPSQLNSPDNSAPKVPIDTTINSSTDEWATVKEPAIKSDAGIIDFDKNTQNSKIHVARAGQTYFSIARLYNITVEQLYIWNNLSKYIPLQVGQKLIVSKPQKQFYKEKPSIAQKKITAPAPANKDDIVNLFVVEQPEKATYYFVKAGQTLYRIALINKVSVNDLMRWNKLTSFTIEVGQKLLIQK